MKPTLIINTYAGSLLLAAKAVRAPVVASYEDANYGGAIQAANFPKVTLLPKRSDWPIWSKRGLINNIVIAHPPCAAFSMQNKGINAINNPSKVGVDAKKFQCTVDVLHYALGAGCDALLVESVPGALDGARRVHDDAAKRHGYRLFRVLQNAVTFGLPQWRERFWCVFVRKNLGLGSLMFQPVDERVNVGEVVNPVKRRNPPPAPVARKWAEQLSRLDADFGRPARRAMVNGEHGFGLLGAVIKRYCESRKAVGETMDSLEYSRRHVVHGVFMSNTPRILDPQGPATVLLWSSFFILDGAPIGENDYKAIMGFPRDYEFPGSTHRDLRGYLSRGVCPPVAAWLLKEVNRNLSSRSSYLLGDSRPKRGVMAVADGGILDLRVKRGDRATEAV